MNPFLGQQQAQLETWLAEAQRQYVERTTPQSQTAGDFSSTDFVDTAADILERIEKLYLALNLWDPGKYPLDQILRRTRTRIVVSNSEAFSG